MLQADRYTANQTDMEYDQLDPNVRLSSVIPVGLQHSLMSTSPADSCWQLRLKKVPDLSKPKL